MLLAMKHDKKSQYIDGYRNSNWNTVCSTIHLLNVVQLRSFCRMFTYRKIELSVGICVASDNTIQHVRLTMITFSRWVLYNFDECSKSVMFLEQI